MQDKQHPSLRFRLANLIAGGFKKKDFIQPLSPFDGWSLNGTGRLKQFTTKPEQLEANLGWVFAANSAISEPAAAVRFKLYRKQKNGDREEITDHPILDLLDGPNLVHTGEQLRQLHYTYMNLTGESYILMLKGSSHFEPKRGQLPDALQILPTHRVQFHLGETYTKSIVKIDKQQYPVTAFIRDLNPDPANPYYGRSIIAATAGALDLESQMMEWNRRFFANSAQPSLVFQSNESMDNESYQRWKQQFQGEHTGAENAHKPLLIEGGTVTPIQMSQTDLQFLGSREFSMKEILSMFKVSPGMLGQVENVNRSNLEAGFYIHAVVNTVPRVRQFTRQIQETLVKVFDPTLELDFENPVPEDVEMRLKAASEGVNKWWTIDEVRDLYGDKPLPDGLGTQIIVMGKTPMTLEDVVNGETEAEDDEHIEDPDDDGDDHIDEDPGGKDGQKSDASLDGVKKKTSSRLSRAA